MKTITAAGVALALMAGTSAMAQTVKYDTKIAEAAAKKAAEKLGDIRGSINYDKKTDLVTRENMVKKPDQTSFLPETFLEAPKQDVKLPPMTSIIRDIFPGVDMTITGSINGQEVTISEKIIWEKFDRDGNLIK